MSWIVASVMTRDVETVPMQAPFKDIVTRMRRRGVSALPVTDEGGRVVGIVSEADLLLKEERPASGPGGPLMDPGGPAAKAEGRTAAALMSRPVVTTRPEATLSEAARVLHSKGLKRLPVVDEDGRLVGIVSRVDLLQPFVRSDASIEREVREDLLDTTLGLRRHAIAVSVEDGVVRLEGELETRSLARILARLVQGMEGVVSVDERLRWRTDDITHRAGAGAGPGRH